MTGHDDELLPEGVPGFDDPAYDGLRAELADLDADAELWGPMPADVATRLDEVLADLRGTGLDEPAAERSTSDSSVVPLRRRSSAGRRLLVAAAAVVAVGGGGIGLANVIGDAADDSAVTAQDSAAAERDAAGDAGGTGAELGSDDSTGSGGALDGLGYASTVPRLSTSAFATQSTALLRGRLAQTLSRQPMSQSGGAASPTAPGDPDSSSPGMRDGAENLAQDFANLNEIQKQLFADCAEADVRDGIADEVAGRVAVPILLDGAPALLVVYPAVDGSRVVQARGCDGTTVLVSATVPVP